MVSFTRNMPRMRLGLSCVGLRNKVQLGSMCGRSMNSCSKFFIKMRMRHFLLYKWLKSWVKPELQHQGVKELTKVMIVAEPLIELVPRNKFESSKLKEKGNGKGDEEG
ncbi:hypothetical protein J1N35_025299 [Gossypium stocksii]|uniref:Uncharacterized protein n=1 Tax=Gossypium stocksii TaxID=47602 RepID=A0A9D3V6C8_9ROSI|nr:hypothetical protein J1N35_025299 [Gossypium stocksii]